MIIFNDIVSFILDGQNNRSVSLITSSTVLSQFKNFCNNGSHALLGYIDKDNGISVIVDMFGVVLYIIGTFILFKNKIMLLFYQNIYIIGTDIEDYFVHFL